MENITNRSCSGHLPGLSHSPIMRPKASNQESGKSASSAGPHPSVPLALPLPCLRNVSRICSNVMVPKVYPSLARCTSPPARNFPHGSAPFSSRAIVVYSVHAFSGLSPADPSAAPDRCAHHVMLHPDLALCVFKPTRPCITALHPDRI